MSLYNLFYVFLSYLLRHVIKTGLIKDLSQILISHISSKKDLLVFFLKNYVLTKLTIPLK